MRILLDECVPRPLRPNCRGTTSARFGKKNGELLALMTGAGFEVLLTVDRSLRHQQNLAASGVAVVVMVAASNRLADLVPPVPGVEAALRGIQPGDAMEFASMGRRNAEPSAGAIRRTF